MPRRRLVLAAAVAAMIPIAASGQTIPPQRFAITDVVGLENLQREWGPFQKALKEKTGIDFQFFPVPNRTAAVEALNSKRVDFVLTGPAEYVVFRARTNAVPVAGLTRVDYYANIVVLANSPYNVPADLKGKKVALGAIGSTSRHLGPMQTLADAGLDPRTDVTAQNLSTNVMMEALKRGDVAAAGMNRTDFERLRDRTPEMAFRVIARGRDLPMDVIIAGPHVDPKVIDTVRQAFLANGKVLADAIIAGGDENLKFKGMHWVTTIKDADYDYVRRMYATIGQPQFSDFVGN